MHEGIKLPKFLKSLDDIYSNNLRKVDFNKYYDKRLDQYSIDLLRDLFAKDERLFRAVRDELNLRGIKVLVNNASPNIYSFNMVINYDEIIVIDEPGENYKNIDFISILNPNIIFHMDIDNDLFFNYIPIENFSKVYKNVNISNLKRQFKNAGFKIVNMSNIAIKNSYMNLKSEEEISKIIINKYVKELDDVQTSDKKNNQDNNIKEINFKEHEVIELYDENSTYEFNPKELNKLIMVLNKLDDDIKNTPIKSYFNNNKTNTFVRFSENRNKFNIGEITIGDIIDYRLFFGVTDNRYIYFIDSINNLNKAFNYSEDNNNYIKENFHESDQYKNIIKNLDLLKNNYGNYRVSCLFGNSYHGNLTQFLFKRNIFKVNQISHNDIYDYIDMYEDKLDIINKKLESINRKYELNESENDINEVEVPSNNSCDNIDNLTSEQLLETETVDNNFGIGNRKQYENVDFKNIVDLRYTKPVRAYYYGKKIDETTSWADVYAGIFKAIYKAYDDYFRVNSIFGTGGRIDLGDSSTVGNMVSPKKITDNLYLETNYSSTDIVKKLKFIIDRVGVDYSYIIIKYEIRKKDKLTITEEKSSQANNFSNSEKESDLNSKNNPDTFDSIYSNFINNFVNTKQEDGTVPNREVFHTEIKHDVNDIPKDDVVDFNNIKDLRNTIPIYATLYDLKLKNIDTWKDLYVNVFRSIFLDYKDKFNINDIFGDGKYIDLGNNRLYNKMLLPEYIVPDLYLETYLDPNEIIYKIKSILNRCNIGYDSLFIKYSYVSQDGIETIENNTKVKEESSDLSQKNPDNDEYLDLINKIKAENKDLKTLDYFKNSKFPSFGGFLNIKNVTYIGEISSEDIKNYIEIYNISELKKNKFIEMFNNLSQTVIKEEPVKDISNHLNSEDLSNDSEESNLIKNYKNKNEITLYSNKNILDYNLEKIKLENNKKTNIDSNDPVELASIENIFSYLNNDFKSINLMKYFHESEFNKFREFIDNNSFRLLGDLSAKDLLDFKNTDIFTSDIFIKVLNKLEDLDHSDVTLYGEVVKSDPTFYYNKKYFDLDEIYINDFLDKIGSSDRLFSSYKFNDIYNKKINKSNFYLNEIESISKLNQKISTLKGPNEIIADFFKDITEKNRDYFYLRYKLEGKTYEFIANKYNSDPQSVKMIVEESIVPKLIDHLIFNNFKLSLYINFIIYDISKQGIISYDAVDDLFKDEWKHILNFIIDVSDKNSNSDISVFYNKKYRLFFKDKETEEKFLSDIEIAEENLPDVLDLNSPPKSLNLEYFTNGSITKEEFLISNGYLKNGKIFSKKDMNVEDFLIYYLKNDSDSVKINEETFKQFKEYLSEKYEINLDISFKNLIITIDRSEYLIDIGDDYISLFDLNHYGLDNLDKYYNYIKEDKENDFEKVYDEFKYELSLNGILNKTHLRSIMKILYDDII